MSYETTLQEFVEGLQEWQCRYMVERVIIDEVGDSNEQAVTATKLLVPSQPSFFSAIPDLKPVMCQFFLSVGQTRTQLHRDIYDNIYCCLHGQRRWLIAHAGHREYVEDGPGSVSARFQPLWPPQAGAGAPAATSHEQEEDDNTLFKAVRFTEVLLCPGDALYLPRGYWHAVEASGLSSSAVNWYFSA